MNKIRQQVLHLPSVKLHLSQLEDEGVLHGDAPSSPPEAFHQTELRGLNTRPL